MAFPLSQCCIPLEMVRLLRSNQKVNVIGRPAIADDLSLASQDLSLKSIGKPLIVPMVIKHLAAHTAASNHVASHASVLQRKRP